MSQQAHTTGSSQAAARTLIEAAKFSLDRAPVLQALFERLAGMCGEGMRALCTPACTFMSNGLSIGSTWDLVEPYEDGLGGIYYAREWDARIIIGCDRRFVFSLVDAMFGGDGTEPPYAGDRAYSTIEIRSLKEALGVAATALQTLFLPIAPTAFALERIETRLDFSTLGVGDAPAVMAQFVVQLLDGGGRLFVLIPQAALAPFRKRFEREPPPDSPNNDPVWSRQMQTEIGRAEVPLYGTMDGPSITLAAIAAFKVGQILNLGVTPESLVTLEGEGQALFRCRLGQSKGLFTLRVEESVDEQQLLLSEIINGSRTG
jgi:flagellar motor switch protein FliM